MGTKTQRLKIWLQGLLQHTYGVGSRKASGKGSFGETVSIGNLQGKGRGLVAPEELARGEEQQNQNALHRNIFTLTELALYLGDTGSTLQYP